ncbi:uncharacterized protein LOC127286935 [Leptopilina boulardi]|uniref:uncharacterized protein LOC127286935 n=1 Tax=Leptopilina boulardi TaxID=63433 RepID=UPI0021F5D7FC|nr:uncharacterized protein LOC127286935 [Leptopilina boulardi]
MGNQRKRSKKSKSKSKKEVRDWKKIVKHLKHKIKKRERRYSSSDSDSRDGSLSSSGRSSRSSSSSKSRSRSPIRRKDYSSYSRSHSRSRSKSSIVSVENPSENAKNDKNPPLDDDNLISDGKVKPNKLDILGEDPAAKDSRETKLHPDVASRWKYWLISGITEKEKEDLLNKYPRKGDCLLEPPQLNPEIKVPMNDIAKKRDDHFQDLQRLTGSALAAIGPAISNLLGEEQLQPLQHLQLLSDAGKMMTELFHAISIARRAFITPGYSKTVRDILNTSTENQVYLFNDKLNEKVNEAKTFEKLNRDMKNAHGSAGNFQKPSGSLNSRSSSSKRPETTRMS